MSQQNLTDTLVSFICAFKYETLSEEVIMTAKAGILDWVALTIAGAQHDSSKKITRVMSKMSVNACDASLLGLGFKDSTLGAALLNGYYSHVLDFDDTHFDVLLHGTASVLPGVFAEAEVHGSTGKDIISSYVIGYEIQSRLAKAMFPQIHNAGWHITGVIGPLGAAGGIAKLLSLDNNKTAYALGIAGSQSTGFQANRGTDSKAFNVGRAAMNGVLGVELAVEGFTSSKDIIGQPCGIIQAIGQGNFDEEIFMDGMGNKLEILNMGFKPYPNGIVLHAVCDAILSLRKRCDFKADDVKSIKVLVNPLTKKIVGNPNPTTGLESKFSIAHCIAAGIVEGEIGIQQFTNDCVQNDIIRSLYRKIEILPDNTFGREKCVIMVELKGGLIKEEIIENAKGTRQNPMNIKEIKQKSRALIMTKFDKTKADEIIDIIDSFEKLLNIKKLIEIIERPTKN